MSAAGRNLPGNERHENDFYETPGECTRLILPHLGKPKKILDAGAGTGAILRECKVFWPDATCIGVELDEKLFSGVPGKDGIIHGDFFLASHQYDLVIANPPFKDAEVFLEHALKIGETVAFLLRLNWLAADPKSKKEHIRLRAKLHREHPADIYVFEKRPSFTGGGTDATEYAWFVWGPVERNDSVSLEGGWVLRGGIRGNRWFILSPPSGQPVKENGKAEY